MSRSLLMIVAAIAVFSSYASAYAQAPVAAPGPSEDRASPVERVPPVNRDEAADTTNSAKEPNAEAGVKATPADDQVQRDNGDSRASDVTGDHGRGAGATGR